jgi:hypothetical protein
MSPTVTINERFRGPPNSGNGGYVGGVFSRVLVPSGYGGVEVTLRSPIPLDKPLSVNEQGTAATITDGDTLIAEMKPVEPELEIPMPPDWQTTEAAVDGSFSLTPGTMFPGRNGFHPICFCCGAEHEAGLRVFAAPVGKQVAAIWTTQQSWADDSGLIPTEYLWAAMDCPGQFAYMATGVRTGMLGRITARVHQQPEAGQVLMVTAWTIQVDGKKHFAGSAVFDQQGRLYSEAVTVWIGRR